MEIKNFISFADVHWGLSRKNRMDDLTGLLAKNLSEISEYTRTTNIDAVFINGDLFDKHNVNYSSMNACQNILYTFNVPREMIFMIPGNHCLKNNTYELLNYSAISVPLSNFGSEHPDVEQWAFGTPPPLSSTKPIIQIHQYIDDYNYMEFFEMFPNAKYLLTGDNHQHFVKRFKDRIMLNSGPIVRNKSNEEVVGFFHVNTETKDIKVIPLYDNAENVFRGKVEGLLSQEDICSINSTYINSLKGINSENNIPFDEYLSNVLSKDEFDFFKSLL